jgi:hypothetical protein
MLQKHLLQSSTFSDEYQDDSNMLDAENKQKYMSILGSLIFLLRTRPDIAYAVNRIATRTCRATIKDMYALGRILKYLAGTVDLGLRFNPSQREDLTTIFCHVDAAYACHIDGKSHSGYCFSLGSHHTGKFYCRSFAKQANVTTSSTEAECDALKEAAKEIEWMRFMMEELGFPQTEPTQTYEDNKSSQVNYCICEVLRKYETRQAHDANYSLHLGSLPTLSHKAIAHRYSRSNRRYADQATSFRNIPQTKGTTYGRIRMKTIKGSMRKLSCHKTRLLKTKISKYLFSTILLKPCCCCE